MEKEELKRIRLDLGLTQVDLAQLLDVSRITYVRWENGENRIPGMTRLALKAVRQQMETEGK